MEENNQKSEEKMNPFCKKSKFKMKNCEEPKLNYIPKTSYHTYGDEIDGNQGCEPNFNKMNLSGFEIGCHKKKSKYCKNVWKDRYLKLQAEMIDETRKWTDRFESLLEIQREHLDEYREESERAMESGFEEAYQFLKNETDYRKKLEKENQELKAKLKELENL